MTKRNTPEFTRNRLIALENEPICHWCTKAPSTEADHLIEVDRGGTDDIENLCGSCKSCNATRGNRYLTAKRTHQQHARAELLGLDQKAKKTEKPQTFLKNQIRLFGDFVFLSVVGRVVSVRLGRVVGLFVCCLGIYFRVLHCIFCMTLRGCLVRLCLLCRSQ